ncbi:thiamine pyrophosphate-binding protein [Pseudactinotalea sp. HY158]|uniref:thiamine pyrophosphate-binding protein n=1 Tax=Pseudactinotalea sp. HY158 TaxID=2654547 RepID=UPI00129C8174|nr:thiamine pyrophosphate-binding protein [Pseudactinotalea sp. HY158]QGH69615.1 thiamine pyrophosphate-binding protein [Pseudactinotalea sp. HY158]
MTAGTCAGAIGRALVDAGIRHVFGVVGSGNFHLTNAMIAAGATFTAARHEGGAATMADAYARTSGAVTAVSVHQGCGYTNAITGIAEAAKSRTPLVVLAPLATAPSSNFAIDQGAIAAAVGAESVTLTDPGTAARDAARVVARARDGRRTIVLQLPLPLLDDVAPAGASAHRPGGFAAAGAGAVEPGEADLAALAAAIGAAKRPVFVAGRGGRAPGAREALLDLAEASGALVATSAVAAGLFHGDPWDLGISGGFSSPGAAELIRGADLIVGWGCALNMWTMRHGRLIGDRATVAQVDDTTGALGAHREIDVPVVGDVSAVARALLGRIGPRAGYRTGEVTRRLAAGIGWRHTPFDDASTAERIDPRTLTLALDELLPLERVIGVDSGNFMGYPSAFLRVPDERGLCFTQAFQSIGLGLATAIGAALAQPDRLPIAALGDGGALMAAAEFETLRRLGLPMLVIVYNDDAYGAEVHHFAGENLDTVTFPPTDIAAIARGYGLEGVTVRRPGDLDPVRAWLDGPRERALVIDAKVTSEPSWWLAEAFGH